MNAFARPPQRRRRQLAAAWLVHESNVLSSANVAVSSTDKRRGMKAFADASVPLVLQPCRWVHSLGMHFSIDAVYLDCNDTVVAIRELRPWRVARPVLRSVRVVETAPGACKRWGVSVGDIMTIRLVSEAENETA